MEEKKKVTATKRAQKPPELKAEAKRPKQAKETPSKPAARTATKAAMTAPKVAKTSPKAAKPGAPTAKAAELGVPTAKAAEPGVPTAKAAKPVPAPAAPVVETPAPAAPRPPLKVLVAASECVPFVKTGGLADVVGSLPRELKKLGADVRVILPEYSMIPWEYQESWELICEFTVDMGWRKQYCGVHALTFDGVTYYFLDNKQYFGREYIYGNFTSDEGERFAFFSKAVLEVMRRLDFYPDVLHCNDWQAGMIVALLKMQYAILPAYRDIRCVFTIHNLRYQGIFPWAPMADYLSLPWDCFTEDKLEYFGCINFLKAGLVYADAITTVSPSYAMEIRSAYYGETLDGVLRSRGNAVSGILNGLDVEMWDPATDTHIAAQYGPASLASKAMCKEALQREFNLETDPDKPLIAMVTRLNEQKGLDLVERVINEIVESGVQLCVLGRGDSRYEGLFSWATWRYPGKVGARFEQNEGLAHRVYAGADMFLMPSAFEPCGLSQMIAMRYGAVPIVRETGGLKDTVIPYNKYEDTGLGFTFTNYNAHEMLDAIYRAIGLHYDKAAWQRMMARDMERDFRWTVSAQAYMALYEGLTGRS